MSRDLKALLAEFAELVGDYRAAAAAVAATATAGNLRCEGCEDCSGCRFCRDCRGCRDCTYCEGCTACERCTRCSQSVACVDSSHLEHAQGCEDSQHLILCLDCRECVSCIACVGLVGGEYCILNRQYERKDFFRLAKALRGHLAGSGSAELLATAAAAEPRGGFVVDSLDRLRARLGEGEGGGEGEGDGEGDPLAAESAGAGAAGDALDESDSPWTAEALAVVDRVDADPEFSPPRYARLLWDPQGSGEAR